MERLCTTETFPQPIHAHERLVHSSSHPKRVLDVLHEHAFALNQHADDIEPIRFLRATVTVDPDARAASEFALLAMVHGFDGITELRAATRFHLDERNQRIATNDEIDIAVPVAEAAVHDAPAFAREPSLCDAFSEFADTLIVLGHASKLRVARSRA